MYLYHVDVDVNSPKRKKFIPRVPKSAGKTEDRTIPRICLSDNITKCIQAIPGLSDLTDGNKHRIRVYKYRVDKRNHNKIVGPRILFNKKLVPDALENSEYWCLKPIIMDSDIYEISGLGIDFDLAWTTFSKQDIINAYNKTICINNRRIDINYNIKNSYDLYIDIINKMEQRQMWDEFDAIWDNLAELPFAQIKRISKIKLHKIDLQ